MTSPAAAAILDGMPELKDVHAHHSGGMSYLMAGPVTLAGGGRPAPPRPTSPPGFRWRKARSAGT
jgi:hypothetical protein